MPCQGGFPNDTLNGLAFLSCEHYLNINNPIYIRSLI